MKKSFLRPDEIAWKLDVSKRTVYRLIRDGVLIAFPVRPGGAIRIPRESFEKYVKTQIKTYQESEGIILSESETG